MFHLGWFLGYGFGAYGWNEQWSGNVGRDVANPQLFIDAATSLERAGFDYMMLEDSSVLPDVFGSSFEYSLRTAIIRQDPMPLVPLLAAATKHLGIIATAATPFYPPFLAARLMNTLDHLSHGRVGMNLVTASPHAAAQNYGYEQHFEHDLRYEMADEWVQAVKALWSSWDADALVLDEATGVFADHEKVRHVDFEGQFYRTRGPLNTVPSPQHHPVLCQAGGSPKGRDLGAKNADTLIASAPGVAAMKEYRDDIRRRAAGFGRNPDDLKVLFLVQPVLGDTDREAEEKNERMLAATKDSIDAQLANLSYTSGFDFAKFDLDEPLPQELKGKSNGHQSVIEAFLAKADGKTLREALPAQRDTTGSVRLVGSPETVAAQMDEAVQEAGGDGFLIGLPVTRKNLTEVCDGLAPVLRRRGLIRDGYEHDTFRENLLAF
ncbi:NtaA/DmoA family FMN-dependent monooxygenase [Frondihabitans australicus]|uniref:FMN-dependent oxidoreductase (Nitrilotriacetate monooxygenase family) n=1 Tax=Frondihabitans australicus TaxID=386892 RepID=A0A495IDD9_9MICO|nr:NtaA/DmoA family FMN-dependent monooxygenase [Frondihabitans australicus]RKR73026.1 FMN-dependent oxidoreductase (nitrilotriacetate monooxygenase family) [Frondihabitans australicus]